MTLTLFHAGLLLGILLSAAGGAVLAGPSAARRAVAAFPRSPWAGRALAAAALLVVASEMSRADLGRFEAIQPYLFALAAAAIGVVCWLLDELLAARALGGLFLLAGNPLLAAARWAQTSWRLAVTLAGYAAVVMGMTLVVGPHWFRRAATPALATPRRAVQTGLALLAAGLGFLLLALGPYRAGP